MKRNNEHTKKRLVIGIYPEQYKIKDHRLNKPVCHQKLENGQVKGSMLLQDLDTTTIDKREITYYCPNNIAILLSISSKSLYKAEQLYINCFCNGKLDIEIENANGDKKNYLDIVSSKVCDYIELIQTSIVFGYTALETFANLSIPNDYIHEVNNTARGTKEIYDKPAIERWIPLKLKFKDILRNIYKTKATENQSWWGYFSNLENYRNDIVHQKSISNTYFYKTYFNNSIFNICKSPTQIIKYFYEQHAEANRTNPIWPWLVNEKNYFPFSQEYESGNFEVIGNLYEGIKKEVE